MFTEGPVYGTLFALGESRSMKDGCTHSLIPVGFINFIVSNDAIESCDESGNGGDGDAKGSPLLW